MFIMCSEMWNSVTIYGPRAEIARFRQRFIVPAPPGALAAPGRSDAQSGPSHRGPLCIPSPWYRPTPHADPR